MFLWLNCFYENWPKLGILTLTDFNSSPRVGVGSCDASIMWWMGHGTRSVRRLSLAWPGTQRHCTKSTWCQSEVQYYCAMQRVFSTSTGSDMLPQPYRQINYQRGGRWTTKVEHSRKCSRKITSEPKGSTHGGQRCLNHGRCTTLYDAIGPRDRNSFKRLKNSRFWLCNLKNTQSTTKMIIKNSPNQPFKNLNLRS